MAASQALTNASSAECAQALAWKCVVLTKIDDAGIRQREPIIKLIVPAGGAVAIGLGLVEGRRPRGYLQSAWLWEGASWCDENGALGLGRLSPTPEPSQP